MLIHEDALLLKILGYLGKRQSPVNKTDDAAHHVLDPVVTLEYTAAFLPGLGG